MESTWSGANSPYSSLDVAEGEGVSELCKLCITTNVASNVSWKSETVSEGCRDEGEPGCAYDPLCTTMAGLAVLDKEDRDTEGDRVRSSMGAVEEGKKASDCSPVGVGEKLTTDVNVSDSSEVEADITCTDAVELMVEVWAGVECKALSSSTADTTD